MIISAFFFFSLRVAVSLDSKEHYHRYRARSLVDSSDSGFVSSFGNSGHSIVPELSDHVEDENVQPQDIRDAVLKGTCLGPRVPIPHFVSDYFW